MTMTAQAVSARTTPPPPQPRPSRRQPGSALVLMTLAGVLCALATYTLLRDREVRYQVAVVSEEVRAGTVVRADRFSFTAVKVHQELADNLVQAHTADRVDGWIAADSIAPGELVSVTDLRPPSAPAALRAMSLPVAPERAVAGDLETGDRVDVLAVVEGASSYVAVDLRVLGVSESAGAGQLSGTGPFSVTVAVDERAALELATALHVGEVSVVRSTGSTKVEATGPDPQARIPDLEPGS